MSTSQSQKKEAIAQATEQELASLAGRGVRIAGNACSPIVLVKGDLDDAERAGGELAAGPDGAALRKALGGFYPVLGEMRLTDYTVRVIDSAAATSIAFASSFCHGKDSRYSR